MSRLIIFYRYIIRDFLRMPARTLLTLAGVALGIAVVVAVRGANERAIGSFNQSLELIAGAADFQLVGNGVPINEELLSSLGWVWEFADMAVLIEGRAELPDNRSVQVLGIDLLGESPFREYRSEGQTLALDLTRQEFIDLLIEPCNLIIPSRLAHEAGIAKGERIALTAGDREVPCRAGAFLDDAGVARAYSGQVVFLDLAAAQELLNKGGSVDRVDFRLRPGTESGAFQSRLQGMVPPTALVTRPEDLKGQSVRMLRAFRFNLGALSYLSLIVGMILVHNTLTISVVRRRAEIAILRTLGASRWEVLAGFLGEAVLLGVGGGLAGFFLGGLMERASSELIGRTVEALYTGVGSDPLLQIGDRSLLLQMVGLGAVLGGFSGLLPALRATQLSPASVLRQGFLLSDKAVADRVLATVGLVLTALGWVLSQGPPVGGLPLWGYASAIVFILGFGLMAPWLSRLVLRISERPVGWLGIEAQLAMKSVLGGLSRLTIAVVSLSIAISMFVSVSTMVESFRRTVVEWLEQTLSADLYVKAAGAGANDWDTPIRASVVEQLESIPGVAAVGRFRGRTIEFRGEQVVLAGGDFKVTGQYGKLLYTNGQEHKQVSANLVGQRKVIVSEPLALKFGIAPGDVLTLPAPAGWADFAVEAIYYDYSSERGLIVMDQGVYSSLFSDPDATSLAVFLDQGESATEVRDRVRAQVPDARLQIYLNRDLRREALRVFDQTFRVTYGLEAIAIVVAVLGITNTLAALILERRGEIALLRFLGAEIRQVRRMAVLEAGLVGFLGCLGGLVLGLILSLLLIFVINRQSFGWTIQFFFPMGFLGGGLLLVLVATVVAAVYPAMLAARTDSVTSLRSE